MTCPPHNPFRYSTSVAERLHDLRDMGDDELRQVLALPEGVGAGAVQPSVKKAAASRLRRLTAEAKRTSVSVDTRNPRRRPTYPRVNKAAVTSGGSRSVGSALSSQVPADADTAGQSTLFSPQEQQEQSAMPINAGYSDPASSGDYAVLPVGEHPCKLVAVKVVERPSFNDASVIEQQIQWTFEALRWKSPDGGKPGVISQWTGLLYGNPKAKLTALLDQFFGRSLTQAEVGPQGIDMELLAGQVEGYVMVIPHTTTKGEKSVKFGGFRHPEKRKPPVPAAFIPAGGASGTATAASADSSADSGGDPDNIPNPFGPDPGTGGGADEGDPFS